MFFQSSVSSTGRGGFAPRKGRGGKALHPHSKRKAVEGLDLKKHPLGDLLVSFSNSDLERLEHDAREAPQIRECKHITSYNWTAGSKPTIIVPGKPPRWTPMQKSQRLREDDGIYFRDLNSAKAPVHPTEPAVRAIFQTDSTFPTSSIDIFACGSTLGNILRFVRSIDKAFRFNAEVIGNTVFFVRKENDPREIIEGVRGFGHTFPEAYTTWDIDVRGSESNQRLVQYKFGGLNCVLRFECDGYLEQNNESMQQHLDTASEKGDLLSALNATSISSSIPNFKDAYKAQNNLIIKPGCSTDVSQSSIFDLKTRSNRYGREIDMSDIVPALWIKQVPNFIIAYHDGTGLFEDRNIKVQDVREKVRDWELDNKQAIHRLGVLLRKIIDVARKHKGGLLEVCRSSKDRLEVRSQYGEGTHALPASLKKDWVSRSQEVDAKLIVSSGLVNLLQDTKKDGTIGGDQHSFLGYDSGDEERDYTACSGDCGYCGKCTY